MRVWIRKSTDESRSLPLVLGNLPMRGCAAVSAPGDLQDAWKVFCKSTIDAFVGPLSDTWISSSSDEGSRIVARNWPQTHSHQLHYGNVYHDSLGPVPPTRQYEVFERVRSPRNSMKGFKESLARNDIIFKPLKVKSYVVVSVPGIRSPESQPPYGKKYIQSYVPWSGQRWPDCTMNRVFTPVHERSGVTTSSGYKNYVPTWTAYDVVNVVGNSWYHPNDYTRGLSSAVASFVNGLLEFRPDEGLVTSVTCEANVGCVDALTELAELMRETLPQTFSALRLLLMKYKEVRKTVKTLRKNNIASDRLSDDISSLWLNFRYGIGPLAYTIDDLLTLLSKREPEFRTYRDGLTRTRLFEYEGWTGEIEFVDRCVIRDKYDLGSLNSFERLTSQIDANPIVTAWELAPLSFIVDWAFNIGDVLSASFTPKGVDARRVMYSRRINGQLVLKHPDLIGAELRVNINSYSCRPISATAHIGLSFNPSLNWKRLLDACTIGWLNTKNAFNKRY